MAPVGKPQLGQVRHGIHGTPTPMPVREGQLAILKGDHPKLRRQAMKVRRVDDSIRKILDQMIGVVVRESALGLAAPQVGIPLKIIFVQLENAVLPLINPKVVKKSKDLKTHVEGCLSLPRQSWAVPRSEWIIVKGRNYKGNKVRFDFEGLDAAIVQHELDHLDGKLLSDVSGARRLVEVKDE